MILPTDKPMTLRPPRFLPLLATLVAVPILAADKPQTPGPTGDGFLQGRRADDAIAVAAGVQKLEIIDLWTPTSPQPPRTVPQPPATARNRLERHPNRRNRRQSAA